VAALPGLASLLEHPLDANMIIDRLLLDLGSRARHSTRPSFHCPCTRDRALRTLSLLERSELDQLIGDRQDQEVICDFCGRSYQIAPAEMQSLLDVERGPRS
jgi:molecular chaperone Hsp33